MSRLPAAIPAANDERDAPVLIAATGVVVSRYPLFELAALITGYTVRAMNKKVDDGVWVEGREWIRSPDGRRHLDMVGYEKWCIGARHGDE